MTTIEIIREIALSLPEVTEEPHFEKVSFRIRKKIFATFDTAQNRLCVKFSETDQDIFACYSKTAIYPVPNKWGKQGWTQMEPEKLNDEIIKEAVTTAYCTVAPKKLTNKLQLDEDIT